MPAFRFWNLSITFLVIITLLPVLAQAQKTVVKGRVTDAASGDGLPFVNVYFINSDQGADTDFDGYFTITTNNPTDSIKASYVGFLTRVKAVPRGGTQNVNFQLKVDQAELQEVVVTAGENPAHRVIRQAVANKKQNNKLNIPGYKMESYNKIEIAFDNLSEKFRQKKVMKQITQIFDSLDKISGEDGNAILPVFISESLSDFYYRSNPSKQTENIKKTHVTGVGFEDGSVVNQLVGSSFQEYNFYENWLNIVNKDFVSPIADGWKLYYDYLLQDSLYIGNDYCYKIDVEPKRPQDLAFTGTIWVTANDYALKQVDVKIGKQANLNFVELIKIQQTLQRTESSYWLPQKTRVLIDLDNLNNDWAGVLAKFYTSNEKIELMEPKPLKFFDDPITVEEDVMQADDSYWQQARHDSLSDAEKSVYAIVDSVKNLPVVKTYVEILDIFVNGYYKVGMFDVGPYVFLYHNNNIEGNRFSLGFRTNESFSRKWILRGYAGYGLKDEKWKYQGKVTHIVSRKPWTLIGAEHRYEIDQVGIVSDDAEGNTLFYAFSRFGTLRRPFYASEYNIFFQTEIVRNVTEKFKVRYRNFDPVYLFAYKTEPGSEDSPLAYDYSTTELVFETRYARNEVFLQADNERISLGAERWPIVTFTFTLGLNNVLNSDFSYQKFELRAEQDVQLGLLGIGEYNITAGFIPSTLPYPLLQTHLGNESPFYNALSFNMMQYFEFVSDKYVALKYQHHFEGFILNRVPVMRKLKWRIVASTNLLYGGASQENRDIIPAVDDSGSPVPGFTSLASQPYAEVGYGIENIFKILRVDFLHRLNYLDSPGADKFGVKFSAQFRL